jgi:hypothetical protein
MAAEACFGSPCVEFEVADEVNVQEAADELGRYRRSVITVALLVMIENQDRQAHFWSDEIRPSLVESTGISDPLPVAEPRLGRRTALTFPLLPPPQKN